jgi:uncharacterized peroxidase-related enzyme
MGDLVARLPPAPDANLADLAPILALVEGAMGFVPNSLRTMARWPELMRAFAALAGTIQMGRHASPGLRQLVAFVASRAAGCRYCQAHTAHQAERSGIAHDKIAAAFEFETSPLFDEAERAALRLARDASVSPSAVTDDHFEALREHFSEETILEIVATIALFGFLNRWNDTLATSLEDEPLVFGERHLSQLGWRPGPHGGS